MGQTHCKALLSFKSQYLLHWTVSFLGIRAVSESTMYPKCPLGLNPEQVSLCNARSAFPKHLPVPSTVLGARIEGSHAAKLLVLSQCLTVIAATVIVTDDGVTLELSQLRALTLQKH